MTEYDKTIETYCILKSSANATRLKVLSKLKWSVKNVDLTLLLLFLHHNFYASFIKNFVAVKVSLIDCQWFPAFFVICAMPVLSKKLKYHFLNTTIYFNVSLYFHYTCLFVIFSYFIIHLSLLAKYINCSSITLSHF